MSMRKRITDYLAGLGQGGGAETSTGEETREFLDIGSMVPGPVGTGFEVAADLYDDRDDLSDEDDYVDDYDDDYEEDE